MRPALLLKRRGLAYPGWLQSGFDPSHPASSNLMYSGVARNGSFVGLAAGNPKPPFQGAGFSSAMDGVIGPSLGCGSTTGTANELHALGLGGTPTQATIAGIARFSNLSTYNGIFGDSFSDDVVGLFVDTTSKLMMRISGTNTVSSLAMTAGVPYFCVASVNQSTNINFLLLRLDNGSVQTQAVGVSLTMAASTASYLIANWAQLNFGMTGNLAAVMYNHSYMSMPQLLQWAQDPWGFWYPTTAGIVGFDAELVAAAAISDSLLGSQRVLQM
jgi:hypothetical protein